jgi:hypothetical protein
MKKVLIVAFLVAGCASQAPLSEVTSSESLLGYSSHITPDFLQQHLEVIAHDSLEGRMSGMEGQKIAADYLADFYTDLGFTPKGDEGTYFQHFLLNAEYTDSLVYEISQVANGDTVSVSRSVESSKSISDFIRMFGGTDPQKGDIVFAGFGVNDPDREVFILMKKISPANG